MLLARLAHGAQQHPRAETIPLRPRYDIEAVRTAAGDGVEAARTAARILQLQMDEHAIFQRCWNCEFVCPFISKSASLKTYKDTDCSRRFSAYMACLTLLHSTAQMQLHDYAQPVWQKELSHAKSCLNVLEYCGEIDNVAAQFDKIARSFYDNLTAQALPTDDIDVFDIPDNFEYLFSVPTSSPEHLVQLSRTLLKRVSCPFDVPFSLQNEGTLKAGLGVHTTLPFNYIPQQDARPWSAVEMALSSMPTGRFMGSSQPHGWDVFLNFNTL